MNSEIFYGKDGQAFVVRCPKCFLENYASAVATGQCAWCGYKEPNKKPKKKRVKNG